MTIEHTLEVGLILVPLCIFFYLLRVYYVNKSKMPEERIGAILAYHSFEGVTAIALAFSMALFPELVAKVGEFRGIAAVLAAKAAWTAFFAAYSEVRK